MNVEVIAYQRQHDEAIAEVLAACTNGDAKSQLVSWREFVGDPEFHGGREFLSAFLDGRLVGYSYSLLQEDGLRHFRIYVEPRSRRKGVASLLLERHLQMSPSSVGLQCICPTGWSAAAAFLDRHLFDVVDFEDALERAPRATTADHATSVRLAGGYDAERIAAIFNQAMKPLPGFAPTTPARILEKMEHKREFWLVEQTGNIAGYVEVKFGDARWQLVNLATDEPFRRTGVATNLLKALVTRADSAMKPLYLYVDRSNASARALYARFGFLLTSSDARYVRRLHDPIG